MLLGVGSESSGVVVCGGALLSGQAVRKPSRVEVGPAGSGFLSIKGEALTTLCPGHRALAAVPE